MLPAAIDGTKLETRLKASQGVQRSLDVYFLPSHLTLEHCNGFQTTVFIYITGEEQTQNLRHALNIVFPCVFEGAHFAQLLFSAI